MPKTPDFHFGDAHLCVECQQPFAVTHGKQKFCSLSCASAAKKKRPRKRTDRTTYNKAYRAKNRDALDTKRQAYYEANKELIAKKQKTYRESLPREIVLACRKRWNAAHKEREIKRYHTTRAWIPWLNTLRGAKTRANRDGIPFALTKEWAAARWTNRCEITGIEFILSTKRNPYLYSPSLDRIIPSLGYVPDNCRFVLHAVNALKGAGTDEQMYQIAEAILSSRQNLAPATP